MPDKPRITLYTDGSANVKTKRGGWAAITVDEGSGVTAEYSGRECSTTNNVMELRAVQRGLEQLRVPSDVIVVTDSINVIGWLFGWSVRDECPDKRCRFRTDNLRIRALVGDILGAIQSANHIVHYQHIRGHSGNRFNERCDQLSKEYLRDN